LNLWGTQYGIGVQDMTMYFRSNGNYAWYVGGTHNLTALNPGGGAISMTLNGSGNLSVTGNTTLGSGTSNAHTLNGNATITGNLAIGTSTPQTKLEVNGNLMVSSATANADIALNSANRPTVYPAGPNVPANLAMQVRSAGTGV